MKKLSIILTLFFVSCQQSYAIEATTYYENLSKKAEKEYKRLCNRTIRNDKERIDCLEAKIEYVATSFAVYREYYENTITILDLRYGNGLKNTRQ